MTIQLVHIKGPLQGQIQEFTESRIVIGSEPACQVVFPPATVGITRNHVELIRDGNRFKMVADPSGTTLVNGKPASEAYLKDGDVLTLGDGGVKISFLSQIQDSAPEPATPAPPARKERTTLILKRMAMNVFKPSTPSQETTDAAPSVHGQNTAFSIPVVAAKAPLYIQYGPVIRAFEVLPVTLGRGAQCEFLIDHPSLLDRHAQFFFAKERYWVKDLTGQGSVQVNRQPIATAASLNPSDRVDLSAQGPGFLFLGGGRLKELVEEPVAEQLPLRLRAKATMLMYLKPDPTKSRWGRLKKIFTSGSGK